MSTSPTPPDPRGPEIGRSAPDGPPEARPGYAIILRHLAKLRDGALALFELTGTTAVEPPPAEQAPATPEKTPLERRIDRHMNRVDQALMQMYKLNPEHRPKAELPPEVREQIETRQRTIHEIVGAELHYWSAAIESAPVDRFDPIERSWIARILRLADRVGVDEEHREHLKFLKDWAAQEHS